MWEMEATTLTEFAIRFLLALGWKRLDFNANSDLDNLNVMRQLNSENILTGQVKLNGDICSLESDYHLVIFLKTTNLEALIQSYNCSASRRPYKTLIITSQPLTKNGQM